MQGGAGLSQHAGCTCQLCSTPLRNCRGLRCARAAALPAARACCPGHMLPSLSRWGIGELPSALLQEADQKGRTETIQANQRQETYLLGLMPLWSLVPGLGLLPVQRFVQHTPQVFVEVAF